MGSERAQSSVEMAVLVPLLLAMAVATWQGVLIGWTAYSVQQATRAGARAVVGGETPRPAVVAALPVSMRREIAVERDRSRLSVRVSVPSVVPGFSMTLGASATVADQ